MEQLKMFESAPQDPDTYLDGVKVLLARMDTNPEEFSTTDGKWSGILRELVNAEVKGAGPESLRALSAGERNAILEKYQEIIRTNFTSRVLKTLSMQDDMSQRIDQRLGAAQAKMKNDMQRMLNESFDNAYDNYKGQADWRGMYQDQYMQQAKSLDLLKYKAKDRYSFSKSLKDFFAL
jgi:hypothetical protein